MADHSSFVHMSTVDIGCVGVLGGDRKRSRAISRQRAIAPHEACSFHQTDPLFTVFLKVDERSFVRSGRATFHLVESPSEDISRLPRLAKVSCTFVSVELMEQSRRIWMSKRYKLTATEASKNSHIH